VREGGIRGGGSWGHFTWVACVFVGGGWWVGGGEGERDSRTLLADGSRSVHGRDGVALGSALWPRTNVAAAIPRLLDRCCWRVPPALTHTHTHTHTLPTHSRRRERLIHARHLRQEDEIPLPPHLRVVDAVKLAATTGDIASRRAALMSPTKLSSIGGGGSVSALLHAGKTVHGGLGCAR
jgi:hypothetical protein